MICLDVHVPGMAWLYKHARSQFWQIGWRVGNKLFNRSTKVANRAEAEKKLALFDLMADANVRPMSVDSRVFFLNTLENTLKSVNALYHQTAPQIASGNFSGAAKTATEYQTVLRPLFQTLGGNGRLQNLGAFNHMCGLDDAESRVANRISVNNYLRVADR